VEARIDDLVAGVRQLPRDDRGPAVVSVATGVGDEVTERALARDWIAKAQSRQAAIAAARQFSADTMRALGKR
jgi:hypothetical protein